jgi:hypothetical protein
MATAEALAHAVGVARACDALSIPHASFRGCRMREWIKTVPFNLFQIVGAKFRKVGIVQRIDEFSEGITHGERPVRSS